MRSFSNKKGSLSSKQKNRQSFWLKFCKPKKNSIPIQSSKSKSSLQRRIKLIFNINRRYINIGIFLIILALCSLILILTLGFLRSEQFIVSEIEILGNNTIGTDNITSLISNQTKQNIFLINTEKIRNSILDKYPNIYHINVKKVLPNRLVINIKEKEAKIVIINLNGAYVIDEDAKVVEIINQQKINYDPLRLELINGFGEETSLLVKNIFLEKFIQEKNLNSVSQEERENTISKFFDFSAIPQSEKIKAFNQLRNEIINEIDALLGKSMDVLAKSDYSQLYQVFYYNNQIYNINEVIDYERLKLTTEILKYFGKNPSSFSIVGAPIWRSQMIVDVKLNTGLKVRFGILESPSLQIENFEIMMNKLAEMNMKISEIDLSSEKISVK